jgi:hypothetical protein
MSYLQIGQKYQKKYLKKNMVIFPILILQVLATENAKIKKIEVEIKKVG